MKRKQRGFTLIEMLVALPIGAAITFVILAGIFQVYQGRIDVSGKSHAMVDIDAALHWICRDLVLAQETSLINEAPPVSQMSMIWEDMTQWAQDAGETTHTASYVHLDTRLYRTYDGVQNVISSYITDIGFSIDGKLFTVTITSQPSFPETAVTRTVTIQMRSEVSE
jgi:prepilin-type N-terminal cleavage/methylation domain-containing protein